MRDKPCLIICPPNSYFERSWSLTQNGGVEEQSPEKQVDAPAQDEIDVLMEEAAQAEASHM